MKNQGLRVVLLMLLLIVSVASVYLVQRFDQITGTTKELIHQVDSLEKVLYNEQLKANENKERLQLLELSLDSLQIQQEVKQVSPQKGRRTSMSIKSASLKSKKAYSHRIISQGKADYTVFVINDLQRTSLGFFHTDTKNRLIGTFKKLKKMHERQGKQLVFATNGGIFTPSLQPEGLFVENGIQRFPINIQNGRGNFYLKPNGVFFINQNGQAGILNTTAYKKLFPNSLGIKWALQSGPLLLNNGQIHPAFRAASSSAYVRNGVGIDALGRVNFVISSKPVNLFQFASFFKDKLNCKDALYLDGAISQMYLPQINRAIPYGTFAVFIGITENF